MLSLSNGAGDLEFLTWLPSGDLGRPEMDLAEATRQIGRRLEETGAVLIHERVYGSLDAADRLLTAREEVRRDMGQPEGPPPTFVQGLPCQGSSFAGLHAIAARPGSSGDAEPVMWDDAVAGWKVGGREAEYLYLSDVARFLSDADRRNPVIETEATFALANRIVTDCGWSFGDVCRTWFYLDDILGWYDDFNAVRNRHFTAFGLFADDARTPIPASTGISGRNRRGGWCTLDLLATRSAAGTQAPVRRLVNPFQNEAPEYGSAFSRGLALIVGNGAYVLVSGTASIDEVGRSIHPGDFERQAGQTLDTVGALLAQGGSGWKDVAQGTAFIKNRRDVPVFHRLLRERGLEGLPVVCTIADVCREELLFELDATAIVADRRGPASV